MATAGKILMFPVGNWTSGNSYGFLDIVYYNGSSYIAKTDITNSTINPATDTTNWQILAHGYIADTLSGIDGTDTSGLLGTVGATVTGQALLDEIADRVATKLLPKVNVVNSQTTNVEGYALDARQGNPTEIDSLAYQLAQTNSNLTNLVRNATITNSNSYPYFNARLIRVGNFCILQCDIRKDTAFVNDEIVFTLPNGFKNIGADYMQASGTKSDGSFVRQQLLLTTDNKVKITYDNSALFIDFVKIYTTADA